MGWLEIFVLLLATTNGMKAAIVSLAMTKNADAALKRAIAFRTVTISTVVCLLFALAGAAILSGLKISVEALLLAGGAILFVFALNMVIAEEKETSADEPPPVPSLDIAAFPLAVPLMASPQGLVAIVAIEATLHQGVTMAAIYEVGILVGIILIIMALNLGILLGAERIFAKISPAFLKVVMRIVGLLLCALAVQLMITGFDGLGLIPNP
ncbi:MarC family protein [Desulfopila sp. IMCC35008]|uniref:MarC family protein n=1 Tax=Desulfopila sp. IMCC35008 TaxID=2653858 RepID=UPI0013D3A202|nr:MarC family protein [Desulfopila sp. IMCC35008]